VTKVYFPRLIIPMASVGVSLVDFTVSSLLLIPVMAVTRTAPGLTAPLALLFIALLLIAALGVGTMLSGADGGVPRFPLRGAVHDPALDVRHAEHLHETPRGSSARPWPACCRSTPPTG